MAVCALAGVRHFQDFALDRDFRYASWGWMARQWQVLVYCGLHFVGAVAFFFLVFPSLESFLIPDSLPARMLGWGGGAAKPFVSTPLYLALVRGNVAELIQHGQHRFIGMRAVSDALRRALRRSLHILLIAREKMIAEKGNAHLTRILSEPHQRCHAIRLCLKHLLAEENRPAVSKEHLEGKIANFEMVLRTGEGSEEERCSSYAFLGVFYLAHLLPTEASLVGLIDEAYPHASSIGPAKRTG